LWQTYKNAYDAQSQLAIAMRQVSEVTWRIKNIEMWTHLYESEARLAVETGRTASLSKPAAFSNSDAIALQNLTYLGELLSPKSQEALSRLILSGCPSLC